MKALLERIDSLDADIVTLVDITPPVYEIIKNSKLVQSKYLISPGIIFWQAKLILFRK